MQLLIRLAFFHGLWGGHIGQGPLGMRWYEFDKAQEGSLKHWFHEGPLAWRTLIHQTCRWMKERKLRRVAMQLTIRLASCFHELQHEHNGGREHHWETIESLKCQSHKNPVGPHRQDSPSFTQQPCRWMKQRQRRSMRVVPRLRFAVSPWVSHWDFNWELKMEGW